MYMADVPVDDILGVKLRMMVGLGGLDSYNGCDYQRIVVMIANEVEYSLVEGQSILRHK